MVTGIGTTDSGSGMVVVPVPPSLEAVRPCHMLASGKVGKGNFYCILEIFTNYFQIKGAIRLIIPPSRGVIVMPGLGTQTITSEKIPRRIFTLLPLLLLPPQRDNQHDGKQPRQIHRPWCSQRLEHESQGSPALALFGQLSGHGGAWELASGRPALDDCAPVQDYCYYTDSNAIRRGWNGRFRGFRWIGCGSGAYL